MNNPLVNRFKGNFLAVFLESISKTCHFQISGIERLNRAITSGKLLVGTSWHGMSMMLIYSFWQRIDLESVVMIFPDDFRGDFPGIFANKIGIFPALADYCGPDIHSQGN